MYCNKSLKYLSKLELFQFGGDIKDAYSNYKKSRSKIEKKELILKDIKNDDISKIAIIVPYRNNKYQSRDKQLAEFIDYYHNYLDNLDIYIIEQSDDNKKFNRGALLNIGYTIASKKSYDMYIFHDVDLISSYELKKVYSYKSDVPIHIANIWKEKYDFSDFLGGIISFSGETYEKINGYPNKFYGWGGEDDAMYNRLVTNNIPIYVLDNNSIEIKEMKHVETSKISNLVNNNKKQNILNDLKLWKNDGLNNLKYKINNEEKIKYDNVVKFNVDITSCKI
jgi:hypothetical protein